VFHILPEVRIVGRFGLVAEDAVALVVDEAV
jgi:hypothetical protein